jgi:hypothetical protein
MRKKQSPRDWVQQIDFALEFRRTYGKEDNWGKMEALASNAHNSLASAGPNLIYAMADDMLAVTNVPNPAVLLDPLTPDEIESAPITESIDNQLLLQIKLQREMEYASLNTVTLSQGFPGFKLSCLTISPSLGELEILIVFLGSLIASFAISTIFELIRSILGRRTCVRT